MIVQQSGAFDYVHVQCALSRHSPTVPSTALQSDQKNLLPTLGAAGGVTLLATKGALQ
jgi:hypothetical protein